MIDGEYTYEDFLQKLTMHDVLSDAGYSLNRRDGLRYPSYIRHDSNGVRVRGDKFIITPGGQCCFQPPVQKVFNIISFIKEHPNLFADYTPGMSGDYLVNLVCNRLLNNPVSIRQSDYYSHMKQPKPFNIEDYEIHKFNPLERSTQTKFYPYFASRGIDLYTQYAFRRFFMLAAKTRSDGKVYANLAFPLFKPTDKDQKVVGFEERGRARNDGVASYKGKAEGSNSSEGLWIANLSGKTLDKADKVLWFESAYDAMAYYQLCRLEGKSKKAVYVSTGGNPTQKQLMGMLEATPAAKHHLCFDNDQAGRKFAINYAYTPPPEWRDYVNSMTDPQNRLSGEADYLPESISPLYCKAENAEIEYYSSRSSGMLCKEDLEDLKNEAQQALNEYNKKINEALPIRENFLFETAPNGMKDWNDALIAKIKNGEEKEVTEKETEELRTTAFRR